MCFGLKASFQIESGISDGMEQLLNTRESTASRGGAGFDGFIGPVEIVPGQGGHVGAKNQIGVALPNFQLMFLRGVDGAAHDLKDVGGSAAAAIVGADGNSEDAGCAQIAGGACGDRGNEPAIGEAARADLHRFEQAWKSATGANRLRETAVGEDDRFAIGQIGGNDGERYSQVLEGARFEYLLDEIAETMIAGEPQTGYAPPGNITEANCAAGGNDTRERCTAGVGCAENAADASAGNMRDGDVILFEDLQNAQMSESAREAAA